MFVVRFCQCKIRGVVNYSNANSFSRESFLYKQKQLLEFFSNQLLELELVLHALIDTPRMTVKSLL